MRISDWSSDVCSSDLYPGSGYGNSTVRCESKDRRTRHCNIDTRGGVRLTRRLSDASCVQGRSWGYDSRGVWVSNGCRAEFVSGGGNYGPGYGNRPGDHYYGQTVRCESNDSRPRRRNVPVRPGVEPTGRRGEGVRCGPDGFSRGGSG